MKNKMIKQYVRNSRGVPIGALVAVQREAGNVVDFGWSLCHKIDQFSKEKGTLIARNRALSLKNINIPETLTEPMNLFMDRAERYFYPENIVV